MPTIRKIDTQGRIALPSEWRERTLKESNEVVVTEQGDSLLIRPRAKVDLTSYFDKFEVDVNPETFADYKKLKRALLRGEPSEIR